MKDFGFDGYFLGIDVGTQGTKTVVYNVKTGRIVGTANATYPLIEKTDGTREQDPNNWIEAVKLTIKKAINENGIDKNRVRGIGVSGQQHGFVPLDENGAVIRNAKLWNDTSTKKQCDTIIKKLGGEKKAIDYTGNNVLPGYTASKVLWLKENEKDNYKRLSTILLPHDYVNFYLTGEKRMEPGDASGTAFFDVKNKKWSDEILRAIDNERSLIDCLPPIIENVDPVGFVRKSVLKDLDIPDDIKIIVSSGGGDNMMGAIGTGNTKKGMVTVSLGTSGTVYAYSDFPVIDHGGEFAAFCDSTGGWLPLACTMNVTVATEMIKKLFCIDNVELENMVKSTPLGAEGLLLLPYFNGERTPNIPSGTGVFFGVNEFTLKKSFLARSAMEGVTLGINYGLESMKKEGIVIKEIRLTGGGSKSDIWKQICADIFNAPTVAMEIDEAASFGAAIQAMWSYLKYNGKSAGISELTDEIVNVKRETKKVPRKDAVEKYRELYVLQKEVGCLLMKAFESHRKIIS